MGSKISLLRLFIYRYHPNNIRRILSSLVLLLLLFCSFQRVESFQPNTYHPIYRSNTVTPLQYYSSTALTTSHTKRSWPGLILMKDLQQQHRYFVSARATYRRRQPNNQQYEDSKLITRPTAQSTSLSMVSVSSSESDGSDANNNNENSSATTNSIDTILSQLTTGFPFFVVFAAILAILQPKTLVWVNEGSIISTMLAAVMCGTGLTLEVSDFTSVLQTKLESIPLGVACQFIIMPITAFVVGRFLLYPLHPAIGPELFLGLLLVGCSPGGTASNLVTLIAGANVALSVLLTSCSTMMAVFMTPFLVTMALSILKRTLPSAITATATTKLVGATKAGSVTTAATTAAPIHVSGSALCIATAKVVLLPVITGMILRGKYPKLADTIGRFTPFASVLLVSLICGGVVAQNVQMLASTTSSVASSVLGTISASTFLPIILVSVVLLHSIGFAGGYLIPKLLYKQSEQTSRTISIEVGMQNSALAIVLARSIGAHPLASLPGALSATAHSCIGSMLAAYWRYQNNKNNSINNDDGNDED